MSLSGEDFGAVSNVSADFGRQSGEVHSVSDLSAMRQAEKVMVNYFMSPRDRDNLSYEVFERIGDIVPQDLESDDSDQYMLMELVNDMPDGAADRLPIALEAKKTALLGHANNLPASEM